MSKILHNFRSGGRWSVEVRAVLAIVLGLALTLIIQFYSTRGIHQLIRSDEQVISALFVATELDLINGELLQLESNVRTLLLSGDVFLVRSIDRNVATVREHLDTLSANFREPALSRLQQLIEEKISFHEMVLQAVRQNDTAGAITLISNGRDLQLRDSILLISSRIKDQQTQMLQKTVRLNQQNNELVGKVDFLSTLFAIIIAGTAIVTLLIGERKRKHLQKHLVRAKEQAEQAAIAKENFLANMSHEIRTPLNVILSFTNLLDRTSLDSNQREYATAIHTAGDNLLSIVNDILDFSRIEAGMVRLETIPFRLSDLLQSLDAMFQPKVRERALELHVHPVRRVPDPLLGDPTRLTQILVNLIGNAIKFTEKGRIDLWVRVVGEVEGTVRLAFKIKDTGIGIPEDKLPGIFERFNQGMTETSRRFGGAGLGLSIVKNLVELQGGAIRVRSTPGQGSTFYVELPFRLLVTAPPEPAPGVVEAGTAATIDPAQVRILVVEDNAMNRRIVELLLDNWGFTFDLCTNGREALDRIDHQIYDLILMDIQMPELDGYQAAEAIRAKGLTTPIIAMTAHAMTGEREKCLRHGMTDYLSKPIREGDLHRLILMYTPGRTAPAPSLTLDLTYLREASQGLPERQQELARIFLQQAPRELSEIQQALVHSDLSEARRVTHSLRSTVAYMGLDQALGQPLKTLENQIAAGEAAEDLQRRYQEIHQRLQEAFALVRRQILGDEG